MLFKRRSPASFWQRLRSAVWPQKGIWRAPVYIYHRTVRLRGTPHAIAMGIAAGVVVSWTPLLGLHFVSAFAIAFLFGGNFFAAALGTAFGNPLTFPFIWLSTWKIGSFLLGRSAEGRDHINLAAQVKEFHLSEIWGPLLEPMLVGAIIPGLITGGAFYAATYIAVRSFQQRRQAMIAARQAELERSASVNGSHN